MRIAGCSEVDLRLEGAEEHGLEGVGGGWGVGGTDGTILIDFDVEAFEGSIVGIRA